MGIEDFRQLLLLLAVNNFLKFRREEVDHFLVGVLEDFPIGLEVAAAGVLRLEKLLVLCLGHEYPLGGLQRVMVLGNR